MDKISVIVPVYKVERYINRSVDSLLAQTYSNLEVILVDDGSPDSSGEICDAYAQKDSRIHVIHKQNGGLSDARNVGMDYATGEWIAFLDSDDWYDPTMLETLHSLCKSHEADIGECSYRNFYLDGVVAETTCSAEVFEFTPAEAIESNLDWKYCKVVAWNKLYRRSITQGIRFPVGKLHEDEFATPLFYLAANKIVYADVALVNYERRNLGSITASFKPKNLDACEAFLTKAQLTWREPKLAGIAKKAGDNYCYVLLERVAQCEAAFPECEELRCTIADAYAAFEQLCEHGVEDFYIPRLEAMFEKYGFMKGKEGDQ